MTTPTAGYNQGNDWDPQDIAQVVIEGTNEGTPWNIVRHYRITGIGDDAIIGLQIGDKWEEDILVEAAALLTDKWSALCLTVTRIAPTHKVPEFRPFAAPIVGAVTTDGLPNQDALLMRLTSDVNTKRGRGRIYWAGLPEASANAGVITGAVNTAWQDVLAGVLATINVAGNTMNPVIFSRTTFNELPNLFTPANYDDAVLAIAPGVTGGIIVPATATQRDRRSKARSYA